MFYDSLVLKHCASEWEMIWHGADMYIGGDRDATMHQGPGADAMSLDLSRSAIRDPVRSGISRIPAE